MRKSVHVFTDVVLYVIAFLILQSLSLVIVNIVNQVIINGGSFASAFGVVPTGGIMIGTQIVSALLTVVLFIMLKWYTFNTDYIQTRPVILLFWVMVVATALLFPSDWLQSRLGIEMSEDSEKLFDGIMSEPFGYIAIGIVAPFVEEMVFRGAVLRSLFNVFKEGRQWCAIVISALIFALIHGNLAQGSHAFIIGLLLGWMFYRTRSIIPGVIFHWTNNSLIYLAYILIPTGKELSMDNAFEGNELAIYGDLAFCLIIAYIALTKIQKHIGFPPYE